jgi:hypothetical protein
MSTRKRERLTAFHPGSSFFWGIRAQDGVEAMLCRIESVAEALGEVAKEEAAEGTVANSLARHAQLGFVEHTRRLKSAFAQNDIKLAVITALKLGALGHEFMYTMPMISDFLTGCSVREGGNKGRQSRVTHHNELRRLYNEERPKYPTKGAAYRKVAQRANVNWRKIRRAVTGH